MKDVVIKIDVLDISSITRYARSTVMLPVTFGSCLQLTKGVVAFRDLPPIQIRLRAWNVEDILELLKEGKDVKLITHRQCERYRQYYWYRMTKKTKAGWHFAGVDGEEPKEYSPNDLQALISEMTALCVRNANTVVGL